MATTTPHRRAIAVWSSQPCDRSQLVFNIIYTPGTAEYLQLCVFSLLKQLSCSFRLVANGCSAKEKRLLQTLCHDNPRLEFLALPAKSVLTHGEALSYLQSLEHSDTFCFMDSDILATGDFVSELTPYLDQYAGVFSGSPICGKDDERILTAVDPQLGGRFSRTDTGMCLGSSFLAMYDNRVLRQVMQSTGIDFRRHRWADTPVQYQGWLSEVGLKKAAYDTGKLLNLLLFAQGERLVFIESPLLLHIGGISMQAIDESRKQRQGILKKRSFARRVRRRFEQWTQALGIGQPGTQPIATTDAESMLAEWKRKRRDTSSYFVALLRSLFENRQPPTVPEVGDPGIEEKIRLVTANIVALYHEFEEQLVG